jgi:hypothetical protein
MALTTLTSAVNLTGNTTRAPSTAVDSGSGEFLALVGIIGGSSLVAFGFIALCCRWLINFTSPAERELRRKAEFEVLQKEQEKSMKALLEVASSEAATQRRAEREKQKLVDKMQKQEDIRVRNERAKAKKLRELQLELKRQGTGIVIDGFSDSDEEEVLVSGAAAAAASAGGETGAASVGGAGGAARSRSKVDAAMDADAAAAAADKQRRQAEARRKRDGEFEPELPDDVDEGEAIIALPPRVDVADTAYFLRSPLHEAARRGRLIPEAAQKSYHKPWEERPAPRQPFVPSRSVRVVMPQTAADCPRPPVVVYDEASDDFVYMSHEDYAAKLERERAAAEASTSILERGGRHGGGAKRAGASDAAPSAAAEAARDSELPPLTSAWTTNPNEVALARAHTAIRASHDVKLDKPRWAVQGPPEA